MSIACPSKIHPVWKYMTEHVGEDEAYRIWLANGERMPSPQVAQSIINRYKQSNEDIKGNIRNRITDVIDNYDDNKLKEIYDNYVGLMSKNKDRQDKVLSLASFKGFAENSNVYKYKDTYIFGFYDVNNNVFITTISSSPTSKELLSEAIPNIVKNFNVIGFAPKDVVDKYKRSGYVISNSSFEYDFKGEVMNKYMYASNKDIANKIYGKNIEDLTQEEIKNLDTRVLAHKEYYDLLDELLKNKNKFNQNIINEKLQNLRVQSHQRYNFIKELKEGKYEYTKDVLIPAIKKLYDFKKVDIDEKEVNSLNSTINDIVGTYNNDKGIEKSTGIEGKMIDLFMNDTDHLKPKSVKLESGNILQVSNWRDIFKAKLQYSRLKDIWDYNRFIPNDNIEYNENNNIQSFASKDDVYYLPLKGNEKLYTHYKLLNNKGQIKVLEDNKKTQDWLNTLNSELQTRYDFTLRNTIGGKRILISVKKGFFNKDGSKGNLQQYKGKSIDEVLETLSSNKKSGISLIAKKLQDFKLKTKIQVIDDINEYVNEVMKYTGKTKEEAMKTNGVHVAGNIIIKSNMSENVLIHELLHAAVSNYLIENPNVKTDLDNYIKDIKKILNEEDLGMYGLTDAHEFISELFSNPKFMEVLSKYKSIRNSEHKSIWKELIDIISRWLNIKNSLLEDAMSKGYEILQGALEERNALREGYDDISQSVQQSAPIQSEDEGFYGIDMEIANEEEQKYQEFMDATTKKLIEERKAEKSLLFRAMNKVPEKKTVFMNKIQQINKEIKQLEASSVVAQNIKMADNHIGQMYNVLNRSNISSTELGLISNEIESWGMLIDDWRRPTEDNLLLGKTEIMKDINDLESKLHNVKILHADVSKAHILEKEKKLGYDTTGKDLEQMKDSGMLASTFMDMSQQHQTLVQIMDSQMKDANRDYKGIAKREVENPLKKMMEEKGIDFSKNAHIEMFKQRDKNGKETGKRIGEYSFEFTDVINKLIQKKNWILENSTLQEAKDAVMIEYYSFYANNMKGLNISSWFVTGDAAEIEKDRQELIKQFGEEKTEQLIGQQKALWDTWIQEAADMREAVSDDVELNPEYQSMTVEEKEQIVDAQYNDWVTTYNPEIAYRQQIGLVEQSEKVKNYGNRYLISIPIKYDKKGKLTEWYDKNYENMKKTNTKAYEFNEWYSKKMQELVSMLPMYEQEKITDGYLPEMDSDLIELFFSSKMKFARDMKNSFIDMTGEVLHGDKKKRIPVKYMNNTLDQIRRSIDVLELKNDTGAYSKEINNLRKQLDEAIRTQSYDLVMLMNTFGEMVYNYQFKSKVEDIVLLEKHFLDTAKEVKLDKKGNVVGTKEDQEALKNVRAAMDYMVDNIIYDIKHPQELVTGLKMYKDDVMKEKALELDKQKQQLLKDYMMKKLTKEKYHTELDAIEDKIEELGGSKNFSLAKLIKQGVGFTYLKALGYNPLASINNVLWAMATNIGVAISGQEFNFKEFKQAFGIMLNSTKKSIGLKNKTAEKIYSMMSNMGVLADMGELEKGITNRLSKNIKKLGWLNPHEGFRRGEYFVQGLIAMAKFLHNTVELEDGSNINFWEAHDEKGELRTDIKIKNREQYKGVEDPLEVNEYKKLRNSIIKLNSREHGNYDISSPTLIKKTLVGQLLMMFRSWLPNAIDARFGNAMYDRQLGHEVKGRYRTMYEMGWGKSLMTLKWMAQSIFNKNMSEEDIYRFVRDNKVDIANMRRNMVEIVQLITLVTAMLVLWMGLGDDKDEKTKRRNAIIKTLINLAARTNKDLTMYINPMTFQDFTKNTIPALKTMNDAWLFLKASGKVMFYDDKRYNQRYWLKSASRNVPLIGNIVSAYEQSKKIEL